MDLYRRGEAGCYDREVYRIDDPLFDRTELEDYRLASVTDTVRYSKWKEEQDVALATTVTTRETVRRVTKHKETIGKTVASAETGLQAEIKEQKENGGKKTASRVCKDRRNVYGTKPCISGRRACRWGIVSPWPEVWGWG